MSDKPDTPLDDRRLLRNAALAILALWLILGLGPIILVGGLSKSGTFGDTFGAVNALFSGLALAGVAYAVYLQRRELRAAEDQLAMARNEAKESEESRRRTEQQLVKHTDALVAAAKLNAADAIAKACASPSQIKYDDIYSDDYQPVDAHRVYMQVLLNDLEWTSARTPRAKQEVRSMFRRYLIALAGGTVRRLGKLSPGSRNLHYEREYLDIVRDIRLLRQIGGVWDVHDEAEIDFALKTLLDSIDPIRKHSERHAEIGPALIAALACIEAHATNSPSE
jgi:hypothetical protein